MIPAANRRTVTWAVATSASCSTFLIRLVVDGTFLSEGIQKFLFPRVTARVIDVYKNRKPTS
jgi:hypothetical protein